MFKVMVKILIKYHQQTQYELKNSSLSPKKVKQNEINNMTPHGTNDKLYSMCIYNVQTNTSTHTYII